MVLLMVPHLGIQMVTSLEKMVELMVQSLGFLYFPLVLQMDEMTELQLVY